LAIFQPSVLKKFPQDESKRTLSLIAGALELGKNDWSALFENDKKEVLQIQNQINITDKEIDQMVYKLYGLSDDEIKIVEGVYK
jgi:hypothetical protein